MLRNLSLLGFLLLAFGFSACSDNPSGVQPIDFTINTNFGEDFDGLPAAGVNVTLTNVNSQQVFEGQTDQNGTVLFEQIPAGNYDLQAVLALSATQVQDIKGYRPSTDEVVYNASLANIEINNVSVNQVVALTAGRLGDLVFKQIYYAGSDRVEGALFRDQFIEIYNNSNEVIFADGLYVMGVYGNSNLNRDEYVTATGQFDWNQSLGMPADIDANTDYLHAKWIYRIPGSGEQYSIEPGQSIVIAQTALNHKAPYVDRSGEEVTVGNPDLTVDLSEADFEVYLGNEFDRPFSSDIDNPNVPNMDNIHIFGRDMILDNPGRDAFILFRTDTDPSEFPYYPSPISREIRDNTRTYPQIPVEWVIDAVESQPSPANQIPRKLTDQLDAGYTFVPGGGFSSNAIIRLQANNFGGRVVLKDTNNSTEDFTYLERAQPRAEAPGMQKTAIMKAGAFENFDTSWLDGLVSQPAPSFKGRF